MKLGQVTKFILFILISGLFTIQSQAATTQVWTFTYKPKKQEAFKIKMGASSKETAFKLAAKECFQKLTNGVYPGESVGLDYIDVCANPKM